MVVPELIECLIYTTFIYKVNRMPDIYKAFIYDVYTYKTIHVRQIAGEKR